MSPRPFHTQYTCTCSTQLPGWSGLTIRSVILSESQTKALANIEKKLDSAVQSSQSQSDTILSQLGDVHTAVKDLPRLTSTVDDISAKLDQVVRNISTMDDMSVKLDRVVRSKSRVLPGDGFITNRA